MLIFLNFGSHSVYVDTHRGDEITQLLKKKDKRRISSKRKNSEMEVKTPIRKFLFIHCIQNSSINQETVKGVRDRVAWKRRMHGNREDFRDKSNCPYLFSFFLLFKIGFFCTHIILIAFVLSLLLPGLPLLPSYLLLPPF